ncbi:hypothetical protein K2X05_11960 [bacterium]|nr:hypothetical protein [bacterium]
MRNYVVPTGEIKLAAKAGFLSKRLWQKYYIKGHRSWKFKRWNSFVERGLFRTYGTRGDDYLTLNMKSEIVRNIVGNDISHPPIAYQIFHDEMVLEIVLGLVRDKKIRNYYLEPELKRDPLGFGLTESQKIPDAIAITETGKFAIEVELSRKNSRRYTKALESYALSNIFDEVYFLSNSPTIKSNIEAVARSINYPQNRRPLRFGLISA